MREVPFVIPVSGVVRVDGDSVTIVVNRAETTVSLPVGEAAGGRLSLGPGRSMYDLVLEAAQETVRRKGVNRFSAAELFHVALEKHPELKRNSFISRVIASTPDHPSYRHYTSRREYFTHLDKGLYQLLTEYSSHRATAEVRLQ